MSRQLMFKRRNVNNIEWLLSSIRFYFLFLFLFSLNLLFLDSCPSHSQTFNKIVINSQVCVDSASGSSSAAKLYFLFLPKSSKSSIWIRAGANLSKWNRFSIIGYWKLKSSNNPCQQYTSPTANWNQFISLLCFVSERTLPILTRGQCSSSGRECIPGPSDFTKHQGRKKSPKSDACFKLF